MTFRDWAKGHLVTAEAIYGLILYSVLIAAISDDHTDALEVLLISAFSLIIFWIAHVFAAIVANHGDQNLRSAIWHGLDHSSGMLYSAVLPTLALLTGVFHWQSADDAVSLSLLVAMIVLGFLGYRSYARRGSAVIVRILGALATAMFGFIVIVLNLLVH